MENKYQKGYTSTETQSNSDFQEAEKPRKESKLTRNIIGGAFLTAISLLGLNSMGVYSTIPKNTDLHPIVIGAGTIADQVLKALKKAGAYLEAGTDYLSEATKNTYAEIIGDTGQITSRR